MNPAELTSLLADPAAVEALRNALGLPAQPVARALQSLEEAVARLDRRLDRIAEALEQLTQQVRDLTLAQAQMDRRLEELARRTDQRFVEMSHRIEELTEQTDRRFAEMSHRIEELTEQTDRRFAEMSHRMEEMSRRMEELALLTQRGFEELGLKLSAVHREVGALGRRWGEWVENDVMIDLPVWLAEQGISVDRDFEPGLVLIAAGAEEELDGRARGRDQKGQLEIVAEAKSQITSREVDDFVLKLRRVTSGLELPADVRVVGAMVARVVDGPARERAKETNVLVASTMQLRRAAFRAA